MELYDDSDLSVVKRSSDNLNVNQSYNPKLLPSNLQHKYQTVRTNKYSLNSRLVSFSNVNQVKLKEYERGNNCVALSKFDYIHPVNFQQLHVGEETFEDDIFDIENEYNPLRPNDYNKVVEKVEQTRFERSESVPKRKQYKHKSKQKNISDTPMDIYSKLNRKFIQHDELKVIDDDLDDEDEEYTKYLYKKIEDIRSKKNIDSKEYDEYENLFVSNTNQNQYLENQYFKKDENISSPVNIQNSPNQFGSITQYLNMPSIPLKKTDMSTKMNTEMIVKQLHRNIDEDKYDFRTLAGISYGEVAIKIMSKYGFKDGDGLGKNNQGISAALQVRHISKHIANIVEDEKKTQKTSTEMLSDPAPTSGMPDTGMSTYEMLKNPSKVVLLLNMVSACDIDDELEPEIKDECQSKYGEVVQVVIHEEKSDSVSNESAVRIFIEFNRVESAIKAVIGLHKRYFGGRMVNAMFYDIELFKTRDFL